MKMIVEQPGKYRVLRDPRGSVTVELEGFWTPEDLQGFVTPVTREADRSRAQHGTALVLFDTSRNQVMGTAIVDGLREKGGNLVRQSDRIAIVVASNLLRMQFQRLVDPSLTCAFFSDRQAGDDWLHETLSGGKVASHAA